jgi:hypothetical protein
VAFDGLTAIDIVYFHTLVSGWWLVVRGWWFVVGRTSTQSRIYERASLVKTHVQ